MKTTQNYFIKYGSMLALAVGLMFFIYGFRDNQILLFAICLVIAFVVLEKDTEEDELSKLNTNLTILEEENKALRDHVYDLSTDNFTHIPITQHPSTMFDPGHMEALKEVYGKEKGGLNDCLK